MTEPDQLPRSVRPFNADYLTVDLDGRPLTETVRQVDCVRQLLELAPDARLLDVPCATGRHAVELAACGYHVTGVDLNTDYLARARRRAAARRVRIETVVHDMRDLAALPGKRFDAAIMMYTSFGYFEHDAENLRVLSGLRHVLRPGGRVLVDVINRDWFLRNYRASDYVTDDGAFVTRDYETADGRVLLHQNTFLPLRSRLTWEVYDAVADSGTPLFAVDYRMYSAHELVALIEEAGLRLLGLSGDYDRSVFTPLAPRLLCVAERPA